MEQQTVDIGVVCEEITADLVIVVNSVEYATIVGADFISVSIPKNVIIENKGKVEIKVIDKLRGGESQVQIKECIVE